MVSQFAATLATTVAVAILAGAALTCFLRMEPRDSPHLYTLPLRKQYVPLIRNNTTVAYKTAYFGSISMGTPAQDFTVVFDTGSGQVLLPSTGCLSEACLKHRKFDREQSSTSIDIEHNGKPIPSNVKTRSQVGITFGTGKVTGEFVEDVVCLGTSRAPEHCARFRAVLANNMTDQPFAHFDFDGVFGLGFGALNLNEHFNFFGSMIRQHPKMLPQFSVYLARDEGSPSAITFGGYERWRATSPLAWVPVSPKELGYWAVPLTEVRIGGVPLEECADGDCRAVLDTGTSLLGVPKLASSSMHKMLTREAPPAQGAGEEIDCRTVPGGELTFQLDGLAMSLGVEDYSRPAPIKMKLNESEGEKAYCRAVLMPVDMKPPLGPKVFILGEPVLRRYFTVYDFAEKRVGIALANHESARARAVEVGDIPQGKSGDDEVPLAIGAPLRRPAPPPAGAASPA